MEILLFHYYTITSLGEKITNKRNRTKSYNAPHNIDNITFPENLVFEIQRHFRIFSDILGADELAQNARVIAL